MHKDTKKSKKTSKKVENFTTPTKKVFYYSVFGKNTVSLRRVADLSIFSLFHFLFWFYP